MPERIIVCVWSLVGIASRIGLVVSTGITSLMTFAANGAPGLNHHDVEDLANGSGQQVLAIMLGLCVMAILGLSAVIAHMFHTHEKRHRDAHEQRDDREKRYHAQNERLIEVLAEHNGMMKEFKNVVGKCHDDCIVLEGAEYVKVHKDHARKG
jgi:uncharacterized membrane protein